MVHPGIEPESTRCKRVVLAIGLMDLGQLLSFLSMKAFQGPLQDGPYFLKVEWVLKFYYSKFF